MPKGIYPRKPHQAKPCSVEHCEDPAKVRGWCTLHYKRWKATGDPLLTKGTPHGLTPMERFMRFVAVDPESGCWMWTGASREGRYAAFSPEGRRGSLRAAHLWIYEQTVGPVPEGMLLDHFECTRTMCVNPEHVRPVTARENSLRSDTSPAALNRAKTHCEHGHPFDEANTRVLADGERRCRKCAYEITKRQRAKRKADST